MKREAAKKREDETLTAEEAKALLGRVQDAYIGPDPHSIMTACVKLRKIAGLATLLLLVTGCEATESVEPPPLPEAVTLRTLRLEPGWAGIRVVHDDVAGVTCWLTGHGSISCLRDSAVICAQRDLVLENLGAHPKVFR